MSWTFYLLSPLRRWRTKNIVVVGLSPSLFHHFTCINELDVCLGMSAYRSATCQTTDLMVQLSRLLSNVCSYTAKASSTSRAIASLPFFALDTQEERTYF